MPRRKLSKREIKLSTKPWITKPILAKIRHRDKLYSKIIRCKHSNPNLIYFHEKETQDKDNYRPITVLPSFSKEATLKHLYGYLESNNILYPLQFGFRQKCSTNHAVIKITESIRNSIDNNEFSCGI